MSLPLHLFTKICKRRVSLVGDSRSVWVPDGRVRPRPRRSRGVEGRRSRVPRDTPGQESVDRKCPLSESMVVVPECDPGRFHLRLLRITYLLRSVSLLKLCLISVCTGAPGGPESEPRSPFPSDGSRLARFLDVGSSVSSFGPKVLGTRFSVTDRLPRNSLVVEFGFLFLQNCVWFLGPPERGPFQSLRLGQGSPGSGKHVSLGAKVPLVAEDSSVRVDGSLRRIL